ncbi:MAG: hypothetical protein RLZZ338_234 [Cyanobacteriota bacterium]|jgi:hypothetical protein
MPTEFLQTGVQFSSQVISTIANNPEVQQLARATVDAVASDPLVVTNPLHLLCAVKGAYDNNQQHAAIMGSLQNIQSSVGILQSTTAFIGMGTVIGVGLSAVNLRQTLQLREDVKQMRLEIKHGFIDLKQALQNQGDEIIGRIDEVARDIKYDQHRLILIKAYGQFQEAVRLIKFALRSDESGKKDNLNIAQTMLAQALGDYNNPHLLEETCAAGKLRRMECVWAMEQTRALVFQLQNQPDVVKDCLSHLENKIRQDILLVVKACSSEEELSFLFPEVLRIQTQDIPALQMQMLPPEQLQEMLSTAKPTPIDANKQDNLSEPQEQLIYNIIQPKSHYEALRDLLLFILKPDLRRRYEAYISEQASAAGYKGLVPANWEEVPHLTVANLFYYFQNT